MSETPNVVIASPAVRKALNAIVGYGSLAVGLVVAVDTASPAFDLLAYTTPTWAGLAFLNSALTVGVTIPNIPETYEPKRMDDESDVSDHELDEFAADNPPDPAVEGAEGLR
mgnify:CR=1 FL=1